MTAREKAAEVLWESVDGKGVKGRLFREDCDYLTDALIANALLVTDEQREVYDALRDRAEKAERERDDARKQSLMHAVAARKAEEALARLAALFIDHDGGLVGSVALCVAHDEGGISVVAEKCELHDHTWSALTAALRGDDA